MTNKLDRLTTFIGRHRLPLLVAAAWLLLLWLAAWRGTRAGDAACPVSVFRTPRRWRRWRVYK